MKTPFLLYILLTASFFALAQQNSISITIDDLPCSVCGGYENTKEVTQKLLKTLEDYQVPALGFVNEGKVYTNGKLDEKRAELLRDWAKSGQELGNHTFSHLSANNASVAEYEADLLKGELLTRPLMEEFGKELRYFRHPYLRSGPTAEKKRQIDSVLALHHYLTAPVTMDNDEYIYAYCYHKAKAQGDSTHMRIIGYEYLAYMTSIIRYYEQNSRAFLGYNMKHILLIHANELNADYLEKLLRILQRREYAFVSLEEALTDSAYLLPEAHSEWGISWISRWKNAKGIQPSQQPAASDRIQQCMKHYRTSKEPYQAQAFVGKQSEMDSILENIKKFSAFYVAKDYEGMANSYTADGKIFPNNTGIIEGRKAIKDKWILPDNQSIKRHLVTPVEIRITDDTAYDYGYYEGETLFQNGRSSTWSGKYVIVWKKVEGEWKIYLDIWNNL